MARACWSLPESWTLWQCKLCLESIRFALFTAMKKKPLETEHYGKLHYPTCGPIAGVLVAGPAEGPSKRRRPMCSCPATRTVSTARLC